MSSSLALKNDGTLSVWGSLGVGGPCFIPDGLSNVLTAACGANHFLAVRTGLQPPIFVRNPQNQLVPQNAPATFKAKAASLAGPHYQWKFNGVDIAGQTGTNLTVTASASTVGNYQVAATNGAGWALSSSASLALASAPVITYPTTTVYLWSSSAQTPLQVETSVTNPVPFNNHYLWFRNGAYLTNSDLPTYGLGITLGDAQYQVVVTNGVGNAATSGVWVVRMMEKGAVVGLGRNDQGQTTLPLTETNTIAMAAGLAHGLLLRENGTVFAWGANGSLQTNVPPGLANVVSIAAGDNHSLAVRTNGAIVAWGGNGAGQLNVPGDLTNALMVSAGGQQSLALTKNGALRQWGQSYGVTPPTLTDGIAIASGANFHLVLRSNGSVVAWGTNNLGQANVPSGASNGVVAIAAGGYHALALKTGGTVLAWGSNGSGESTVPVGLSNVMAIAAGQAHSVALLNDGTIVSWGANSYGQTNLQTGMLPIKFVAAGGDFTLMCAFSPLVQYPVDVTKDLLLIYNTNSVDSINVFNYYLQNRPMVAGANAVPIGFPGLFVTNGSNYGIYGYANLTNTTVYESINPTEFTNRILNAITTWFTANPTKRPEYVVLFLDVPSRVNIEATNGSAYPFYDAGSQGSVAVNIAGSVNGWKPLVTSINMGDINACEAYIDKLKTFGNTYSPGKLLISASSGGYGNTNYYFDNAHGGTNAAIGDLSLAITGIVAAGVSPAAITYSRADSSNHILFATNVVGYATLGIHGNLPATYAIDTTVKFYGSSRWYAMETIESFDGRKYETDCGTFITWFANNAFGGTNSPVGAVSNVDEPGPNWPDQQVFFGLWAGGKNFAISAWASKRDPSFQAIGDPFVQR